MIAFRRIEAAQRRIAGAAVKTPLIPLSIDGLPPDIWLKLESFQPIGSFKIRGAANAILNARPESVREGLITLSSGNMAQGVAWVGRKLGVPVTTVVAENAPATKLAAIERLGANVVRAPLEEVWNAVEAGRWEGVPGFFVHPIGDEEVMAGHGTIAIELIEELEDIDTVLVPWGGGGLTIGIADAMSVLSPRTSVHACEPETAAPLVAAFSAGHPVVTDFVSSFVDGAGARSVLSSMWERAREVVSGAHAVSLDAAAQAVQLLAERRRIVVEGAGALGLAAALQADGRLGRTVCIVSGGNIDSDHLRTILGGITPR